MIEYWFRERDDDTAHLYVPRRSTRSGLYNPCDYPRRTAMTVELLSSDPAPSNLTRCRKCHEYALCAGDVWRWESFHDEDGCKCLA